MRKGGRKGGRKAGEGGEGTRHIHRARRRVHMHMHMHEDIPAAATMASCSAGE